MPEIKHTFNAGRMNKDLDERLVPNGEYRDAMNVEISSSEGSNAGAVQNVLGNRKPAPTDVSISGGKCIGAIADTENEKIYWFIVGTTISAIAEYDQAANEIKPIVVDTNNSRLKFSSDSFITGINLIDGLLFWTDDINEPRLIDIQKFKDGSTTFSALTTLLDQSQNSYNFTEEDIVVIKKGPSVPPTITMANTKRVTSSGQTGIVESVASINFYQKEVNDTINIQFNNNPTFLVGDILSCLL